MPQIPNQPSLFRASRAQRTRKLSQVVTYEKANQESAALILADPARYGGPEAGLVVWARAVAGRKG